MKYLEKWKQKHQTISSGEKFINTNIPKSPKLIFRATRMTKNVILEEIRKRATSRIKIMFWGRKNKQ